MKRCDYTDSVTRCRTKITPVMEACNTCTCGNTYCNIHRMPEDHYCDKIDDIKAVYLEKLSKQMIKVEHSKLDFII